MQKTLPLPGRSYSQRVDLLDKGLLKLIQNNRRNYLDSVRNAGVR